MEPLEDGEPNSIEVQERHEQDRGGGGGPASLSHPEILLHQPVKPTQVGDPESAGRTSGRDQLITQVREEKFGLKTVGDFEQNQQW